MNEARRKKRGDDRTTGCAVEVTLGLLGGRWKAVVLFHLLKGKKRFGELRRQVPNCTQRMLTLQLRELEEDGLVTRTVFPQVPPRVEYELTDFGRSAEPMLLAMRDWGEEYKRQCGDGAFTGARPKVSSSSAVA
ncbi:winged helix-turn-helix transcriptional regulator [Pendulispora albinea]|uniref:Helix-turn-helix transcriptional regulator n=1 Tax=Pendulispora albinea TaxID=2741071 RepID=A0ABZ2LN48_9BACT